MKSIKKVLLFIFAPFAAFLFLKGTVIYYDRQNVIINPDSSINSFDAIIVPGVPFENGRWSQTMKSRVGWSYYLYRKGIAKNIIYSGAAVYSPYVEARIMALYGEA